MFAALHQISPENAQKEYYLTDVLGIIKEQAGMVGESIPMTIMKKPWGSITGVQLAAAEKILRNRIREKWMLEPV